MDIELKKIKIKDIFEGYKDSQEEGVVAYGGKLDIRPKYQREFVYKDTQRNAVIETIQKGFPLNVMYWVKNGDKFEVLDGQQRTLSFCQYINGDYSMECKNFYNLPTDKKEQILNYELMIYICEGKESEKLDWFKTINIAGEKLTEQELRNAVYAGVWLTDAKKYFSKTAGPAYNLAKDYVNALPIRQEYLEKALAWVADAENTTIEEYMAKHQFEDNASELWIYFQNVINWAKTMFPNIRKELKSINWGEYYNKYKDNKFNPSELEKRILELLEDEDVTSKKGIYEYLIDGNEKHLSIRAFSKNIKVETYLKQKGYCAFCKKHFELEETEPDHITPWSKGGKTIAENCQILCISCNRKKSNK